jgi:alkanesulfonate monooxygenase SsuD/methylene tetrahydromethanopterin reductase-like flavin-dependent oxidoreductase (luciferase family)
MRIGVALPSMVPGLTRDDLLAWMRGIDEGPFSVLGAGERIAYPNQEMMTLLAGAATATDRVRIEATVSVTPMHAAVHVAKQAATIDVLSGGRFVLGVGVGGRDEDYRALGASFERRHATLDDQVAVMRRVWRGASPAEGVGAVGPWPAQPGGPPLLAAAMGPKSMARAAQWADGVAGFDLGPDPDAVAKGFRRFEAAWRDAGREGSPFLQTSFWFGLGEDAPGRVHDYAHRYLRIFGDQAATGMAALVTATSPAAIRAHLRALEDTGCDEVILAATSADLDDLHRLTDLVTGV